MNLEEMYKKYNALLPAAQKEIDQLLEKLSTEQSKQKEEKGYSAFGALKGKIKMHPDFDEPLEDFKEYME